MVTDRPAPPAAGHAAADAAPAPPARRKKRRFRPRWGRLLVAAALAAAGTAIAYRLTGPGPRTLDQPALTPETERLVLAAIAPGWPERHPVLPGATGAITAAEGRVDAIAAVDADADGRPEWGCAYAWLGPADAAGARHVVPGFAIVQAPRAGQPAQMVYEAPGAGGWDGAGGASAFESATEVTGRVQAVQWSRREAGFLVTHVVDTSVGGRMARGVTRAYLPQLRSWVPAWEQVTETRLRHDRREETATEQRVEALDLDGNGTAELVVTPTWYHRHLNADDRGVHFTAEGPGRLVYRRDGALFTLAAVDGTGPGPRPRIRPAAPLYAVRAPRPPAIDGRFDDWDAVELTEITQLLLDEPDQLRYKRRERRGTHDFSGGVRFMWDEAALYVRADVMDDQFKPAPAGTKLYEGDHLGLWLDVDLGRDFAVTRRNADDWQLGFAPALGADGRPGGGASWTWVPVAGRNHARVASAPLIDPYEGVVRGWRLEAALPWADVGGPPPRLKPGPAPDAADPRTAIDPRRYALRLAGMVGLGVVLTDADAEPQELAYVSAPAFGWGAPRTFNTLMLVEAGRAGVQ